MLPVSWLSGLVSGGLNPSFRDEMLQLSLGALPQLQRSQIVWSTRLSEVLLGAHTFAAAFVGFLAFVGPCILYSKAFGSPEAWSSFWGWPVSRQLSQV